MAYLSQGGYDPSPELRRIGRGYYSALEERLFGRPAAPAAAWVGPDAGAWLPIALLGGALLLAVFIVRR